MQTPMNVKVSTEGIENKIEHTGNKNLYASCFPFVWHVMFDSCSMLAAEEKFPNAVKFI